MDNCVFCKIVAGQIPSYKVYEDEQTLAFLDIKPTSAGHTLVVPKKHYANLEEVPEDVLAAVIKTVKKIGKSLKDNLPTAGYNISENNDPIAGQIIPHLHFHVVPRTSNDGFKLWPQRNYATGEAEDVLNKIKIN